MEITFLGTGTSQGVPTINCRCEVCTSMDFRDKRLRSSIHISVDGKSLIIDTGPDFRQQVLRAQIEDLDAILYTHEHKDHVAGLDDVRGYNFSLNKDIPVYARKPVIERLKAEFPYIFIKSDYKGAPRIQVHKIENKEFSIGEIKVTPIEVIHHKMPVLGFRIGDFAYVTDAKTIADEEIKKLFGLEVLIINGLQKEEHISHLTLEEAVELIQKLQPKQAFITHISHRLGLHHEVEKDLPSNIKLGYDDLKIKI